MFNVLNIINDNQATYYDYRTNRRYSVLGRIIVTIFLSTLLSVLFSTGGDEFLNGVITVQSILVGFNFNAMFFIVSLKSPIPSASASLEEELRINRMNKLTKELFSNIMYYNLVAIITLIVALGSLLIGTHLYEDASIINIISEYLSKNDGSIVSTAPPLGFDKTVAVSIAVDFFISVILYFFLIESVYSFLRTIGRIGFLFEQKMR